MSSFKNIFQVMNLPALVIKPEGSYFSIVAVNSTFLEVTGSKESALVGKNAKEAYSHRLDYGTCVQNSLQQVFQTKEKHSQDLTKPLLKTGSPETIEKYWRFENTPILDDQLEVEYILHTLNDITAQVLLKETQERTLHFVENNPDGFYALDREGNFTSANKGLAKIAEVPLEKLLSASFLPFCAPESQGKVNEHFQKALKGEPQKFEAKFISAQGRDRILEISLYPSFRLGGIIGAYGIAKDSTYLRKSEQVIVEKGTFLKANATFINTLLENGLEEEALEQTFEIVGKAIRVDRMFYFGEYIDPKTGESLIRQKVRWTREAPDVKKLPPVYDIPRNNLQDVAATLERNTPLVAIMGELPDGKLKDLLLDLEVKSMILVPLFVNEKLSGFVGFDECTRERKWSEDEVNFLITLASHLSNALEKRAAKAAVEEQQQAIENSEQKFKALVQEGSDLMAIIDIKGTYQFLSDTTTSILGIPPTEFLGRKALEFIHPDDHLSIIDQVWTLKRNKQVKIGPFRFINSKGEWRYLETTVTNLLNDPNINGLVTNSRDITTLLNQAREIEEINERYRLAATATEDFIYDWNFLTDEVIRFHKDLTDLLGHPIEEVQKRNFWSKHIHPEEIDLLREQQKAALNDPSRNFYNAEYRFMRADGSYAYFTDKAFIIRDATGKAVRMVGATSDISNLKAKEEALLIANQRFEMVMKATNEVIWDWDIHSDFVERAKSFTETFGYDTRETASMEGFWLRRIAEQDRQRVQNSLRDALEDPSCNSWKEEYQFYKADGELSYINDRGLILRDDSGVAIRMVGSVLDVTESHRMLEEIQRQNAILKDISWQQSHVVRAPLARLKGLLELFELGHFEELNRDDIWQLIHSSADELDAIVRKIVIQTEELEYSN